MNKQEFLAFYPKPPTHDDDGRWSREYMEWTNLACAKCAVDGQDGSCLLGLSDCKWY